MVAQGLLFKYALMRRISEHNKYIIAHDPYYKICARSEDGGCDGRITIEHAIIYAGRQLDELWSLIPLCEWHHAVNKHQDGGQLDKDRNIQIALNRATDVQLRAISKAIDYIALRNRLNKLYGDNS